MFESLQQTLSSMLEITTGILHYLPNIVLISLCILGIFTYNPTWILVSIGGIVLTILVMLIQYIFYDVLHWIAYPGYAVVSACSLMQKTSNIAILPSLWITLNAFFIGYILRNAINIYTMKPSNSVDNNALNVFNRKSVGLISMLAVIILGLFLLIYRWNRHCDSSGGVWMTLLNFILSSIVGLGFGIAWWYFLYATKSVVTPDIHGVTIGLNPYNKNL